MFVWLSPASMAGAWIISPKRFERIDEFGNRLFWHEQVGDAGLAQLYSDCDGLIAASFAEGFGLPIVEAGYFGKPVIASDIPVFREVGDGAVERRFFPVGSSAELAETVRKFVGDRARGAFRQVANAGWPTWARERHGT